MIRAAWEAGFSYWGLFPILALIFVGYALWMWRTERRERAGGEGRAERPGGDRRADASKGDVRHESAPPHGPGEGG